MHEEMIPVIKMILEFDQNFELISCQNLFLVFRSDRYVYIIYFIEFYLYNI